jgi:hypothetical protein
MVAANVRRGETLNSAINTNCHNNKKPYKVLTKFHLQYLQSASCTALRDKIQAYKKQVLGRCHFNRTIGLNSALYISYEDVL